MAPLPRGYIDGLQSDAAKVALSEGRRADAVTLVVAILRAGTANAVTQRLAADLLMPPPRGRGRPKALTQYWYEIGDAFYHLLANGVEPADAQRKLMAKFKKSRSHIRKAVLDFDEVEDAAREAADAAMADR